MPALAQKWKQETFDCVGQMAQAYYRELARPPVYMWLSVNLYQALIGVIDKPHYFNTGYHVIRVQTSVGHLTVLPADLPCDDFVFIGTEEEDYKLFLYDVVAEHEFLGKDYEDMPGYWRQAPKSLKVRTRFSSFEMDFGVSV